MSALPVEARGWARLFAVLVAVQLLSGAYFAATVDKLVFDEDGYDVDVIRYETEGIHLETLRAHATPAAPGMQVLAALTGKAFGSHPARRLPTVLSWALAAVLVVLLARVWEPLPAYVGGVALFAFPHVPIAAGTLLTEGPATVAALATTVLFAAGVRASSESSRLRWMLLSGLALGASLWFRQYYLALAPALGLALLLRDRRLVPVLVLAIGPVLSLALFVWLWGGLTSPAVRAGTFSGDLRADIGLNLTRPLSALAFAGVYASPFAWYAARTLSWKARRNAIVAGFVVAALTMIASVELWGSGPLNSILQAVRGRAPIGGHLADLVARTVGFGTLALSAAVAWASRARLASDVVALSMLLFVAIFAVEQAGVGGNIPYYERYAEQTVFAFAAGLAFLRAPSWAWGAALSAVLVPMGQYILWRHAFGGP